MKKPAKTAVARTRARANGKQSSKKSRATTHRRAQPRSELEPKTTPALAAAAASSSAALTWATTRVRLGELVPWQRNPRRISEQASARLLDSFESFGQVELLAIGPDREVYNGHQRLQVLASKYGPDHQVEARVASRALTEKEREKLTVYLHRGATGEFDLERLLADFDVAELNAWGMPELNVPDVAEDEWKGMPEFDGDPRAHASLRVYFECQEDVERFATLINQPVTKDTTSIWYPPKPVVDESSAQWVSHEP